MTGHPPPDYISVCHTHETNVYECYTTEAQIIMGLKFQGNIISYRPDPSDEHQKD